MKLDDIFAFTIDARDAAELVVIKGRTIQCILNVPNIAKKRLGWSGVPHFSNDKLTAELRDMITHFKQEQMDEAMRRTWPEEKPQPKVLQ